MYIEPMRGDLIIGGQRIARAGFMPTGFGPNTRVESLFRGPSIPIYSRGSNISSRSTELIERMQRVSDVERAALMGDGAWVAELGAALAEHTRAITSTTTAFPVRENLEAPAKILVPLDTPVRNMLPRTVGSGLSSAWRQVTSLGGGYGFLTTVTTGAASATQEVGSTAGMQVGDTIQFTTTTTGVTIGTRTVSSITDATHVVVNSTITTVTGDVAVNTTRPRGAGAGVASHAPVFYPEGGCPADHATVYAAKSAAYKLMGVFGSVSGLAIAAGRNYQNQLETEKRHALLNMFLNEENA